MEKKPTWNLILSPTNTTAQKYITAQPHIFNNNNNDNTTTNKNNNNDDYVGQNRLKQIIDYSKAALLYYFCQFLPIAFRGVHFNDHFND